MDEPWYSKVKPDPSNAFPHEYEGISKVLVSFWSLEDYSSDAIKKSR